MTEHNQGKRRLRTNLPRFRHLMYLISDFLKEKCMMKYVCSVCGWVYDEDEAGVKWEDLPDDFACELCCVGKESFEPQEV